MRFVLGPNEGLKVDPNFFLAWKFGAPLPIIYVLVIEQKWGVEHHGGGGCYLDMPKGESLTRKLLFTNIVLLSKQ